MKQLAAILAAVMLVGCNSSEPGPIVDPALSTLVPSDTTMLVGVRVEDLTKTEIYKRYLAERPIAPLDAFAQQMGINPRKDLWELLYISNGKERVMLGRGKLLNDTDPRLEIEKRGAQRMSYRGYTLVGNDEAAVLVMGASTVGINGTSMAGIGNTALLKRIIDTRDKTNGPPALLAERMKEMPKTAVMWTVFAGAPMTLPPDASANMGNVVKIVNSVESGSFYLDLHAGLTGKAMGIAATEQDAKDLQGGMRGLLGLARLASEKSNAPLQHLLDGMQVTQEGKVVNLHIQEPEEAITTLLDFMLAGRETAVPTPQQ
jgi:hypothetical protein